MRHFEFINEDATIPQLKAEIVKQVQQIEDFNILDKLHQILSQDDVKGHIKTALEFTTDNANVPNVESVIDSMAQSIANIPGSMAEKIVFVEALEAGKAINTEALQLPTSPFTDIFPLQFAQKFFIANGEFGRGINLKGPGEFALAIMDPDISLAPKGDIMIDGKHVEVKAALRADQGGRLGEVGPVSIAVIREKLNKVGEQYAKTPEQKELFRSSLGDLNSIQLGKGVRRLHEIFPDDSKAIAACVGETIALSFPGTKIGKAVGKAAAGDPSGSEAELEFMRQNFEWYKKRDGFDSILAIHFPGKRVYNFNNGDEFAAMRMAGYLGSPSVSFIPTKQHEVFAQISFLKKKH